MIFKGEAQYRAVSAVGSEHLPYKQRVGGSNPSLPTTEMTSLPFKRGAHDGTVLKIIKCRQDIP